jgi:sulfur-oxidizing protein SoxA
MKIKSFYAFIGFLIGFFCINSYAENKDGSDLAQYRAMLDDGNPADLIEMKGESLWKTKRGPKNASLERCDFGLGAGQLKGAYAQMPRYFTDTRSVMDFESRLAYCMMTLQGFTQDQVTQKPFSEQGEHPTDIEALTSYGVAQSKGMKVNVPQSHPLEKAAYRRGEMAFFYRAGPYDFSCASCHGQDGKRIRLQELPNLRNPVDSQKTFTKWPAYRLSQGAVRTMQWRIADCFRQQRLPELVFGSQTSIDLITYLAVKANGGVMDAPGIKR